MRVHSARRRRAAQQHVQAAAGACKVFVVVCASQTRSIGLNVMAAVVVAAAVERARRAQLCFKHAPARRRRSPAGCQAHCAACPAGAHALTLRCCVPASAQSPASYAPLRRHVTRLAALQRQAVDGPARAAARTPPPRRPSPRATQLRVLATRDARHTGAPLQQRARICCASWPAGREYVSSARCSLLQPPPLRTVGWQQVAGGWADAPGGAGAALPRHADTGYGLDSVLGPPEHFPSCTPCERGAALTASALQSATPSRRGVATVKVTRTLALHADERACSTLYTAWCPGWSTRRTAFARWRNVAAKGATGRQQDAQLTGGAGAHGATTRTLPRRRASAVAPLGACAVRQACEAGRAPRLTHAPSASAAGRRPPRWARSAHCSALGACPRV